MRTARKHLRILAADDSAVMRGILRRLFLEFGESAMEDLQTMELCTVAQDGVECLDAIARLKPDVLLLDLEMPRLNGLQVLEQLRHQGSSLPVIMCSAHTQVGARLTLNALALGAMDYVMKPSGQSDPRAALRVLAEQLLPRIAAVSRALPPTTSLSVSGGAQSWDHTVGLKAPVEVIVIGVSTGGPTALERILPSLPADFPVPILIAQHMPQLFTQALADRLNHCCKIEVRQAHEGAVLAPGTVWLAPGGSNLTVVGGTKDGGSRSLPRLQLHRQEALDHCTPSVDILFRSAAETFQEATLALVLTGMGEDGLAGGREVHRAGGTVLAQDEQTSAVWGMPARVVEAGIACATLALPDIALELLRRVARRRDGCSEAHDFLRDASGSLNEVFHGMY